MRLALTLVLCAAAAAQEHARWIANLGDPERSEAAEIALGRMGDRAVAPLAELFAPGATADGSTVPVDAAMLRELDRLRAALRVLALLGPDAASAAPALAKFKPPPELVLDVLWTRGCLEPWSHDDSWRTTFHSSFRGLPMEQKGSAMHLLSRHMARKQVGVDEDTMALLRRLETDLVDERCLAAEMLGRLRAQQAFEPLRFRLLDRSRPPEGWDSLRHNGFVVRFDDGFRLSAAEAMLAIAPDDPRCAIALGCRALLHPHRSVRAAALQQLAGLGVGAADAVDELLELARGGDRGLAVEALKLLGMAGDGVAAHLPELERLAASTDRDVASRARSLVARLRASGAGAAAAAPDRAAEGPSDAEITAAVARLADPAGGDAIAAVRALGVRALPVLRERLRVEHEKTPAAVVSLLGEIGFELPQAERELLRLQILQRISDYWQTRWMGSMTHGNTSRTMDDYRAAARLAVGWVDAAELAARLVDEDPYVRLFAATCVAERSEAIPAAVREPLRQALTKAAREEHPKKWQVKTGNHTMEAEADIDGAIQGTAVVALIVSGLAAELPQDTWERLLSCERVDLVARAVEKLRLPGHRSWLARALADERPAVAIAAAASIAAGGEKAAPLVPALELAAASKIESVAAAARAALAAVRGGETPR